jgi:NAD(P)-dependent dehydrogenase (short-subunit alcohol dehydrogenase family)
MNIIITGASRGIGKQLALNLAARGGHQIIILSRNEQKLMEVAGQADSSSKVIPMAFDLSEGDHESLGKAIRKHFSEIHALVNNAGVLVNKKFSQLSIADFDQMMKVNVRSAFLLSQALIPLFEPRSHIVNISSMGGYQGSAKFPGLSLYSASKGALAILSECMAEELKEFDISVNCLALGAAQTEMLAEAFPGYRAPLSAAEMSAFIADFVLTGNRYFNGKILPLSVSTP